MATPSQWKLLAITLLLVGATEAANEDVSKVALSSTVTAALVSIAATVTIIIVLVLCTCKIEPREPEIIITQTQPVMQVTSVTSATGQPTTYQHYQTTPEIVMHKA